MFYKQNNERKGVQKWFVLFTGQGSGFNSKNMFLAITLGFSIDNDNFAQKCNKLMKLWIDIHENNNFTVLRMIHNPTKIMSSI